MGYYICKAVTLDRLAKNSLLCLTQIFYCYASTFKQKGKLQNGNIPLSESVSRSGNPWLITKGDVYNSDLSYIVTLWEQSMKFVHLYTYHVYVHRSARELQIHVFLYHLTVLGSPVEKFR